MLWFQPCPLPWEAGEKVRGAPALACVPTHPPSHQLTGSCKIHHFPSTHPGGNNDNKNKIRTTPFPRLGGGGKGMSSWERLGFHSLSWQT